MLKNILQKINSGLLFVFLSCWTFFLLVDYIIHEKFISKAFKNVTFSSILPVLVLIFLAFIYFSRNRSESFSYKKISLSKISGWKIFGLFFISTIAYVITYAGFIDAFELESTASIASYITFIVSQLFYLLLLLLPSFVTGSFLLDLLPTMIENKKSKLIIGLAVGMACNGILFFILAAFHIMTFPVVLLLLVAICGLGYKRFLVLSKEIFIENYTVSNLNIMGLLSLFTLLVFFIINFNSSLRPIPIGFDELSLYMNTPKLISGYSGLTQGGQAYNWSIWMSLGFVLNNKVSLPTLISILPGILSCYLLYRISRNFLNTNFSILSAVLFYTIPTTIWQSSADAKVDLALVFFTLSAALLLIESNKKNEVKYASSSIFEHKIVSKLKDKIWLNIAIILGVLLGYSFGIKYTALFIIIGMSAGFAYKYSESLSISTSIISLGIAAIFLGKLYTFSGIEFDNDSQVHLIGFIFLLLSILAGCIHLYQHRLRHLKGGIYLIVLMFFLGMTFSPWIAKNYFETKSFSVSNLLNGKPALESVDKILSYEISSTHYHTKKTNEILYAQNENPSSDIRADSLANYYKNFGKGTGKYEEVQRYIGYENGVPKYLSIFHDLGILQNVANFPTDIGLFVLILFPLLFLSIRKRELASNIYNGGLLFLLLLISITTLYLNNGDVSPINFKENIDKIKLANPSYSDSFMDIYLILIGIINKVILVSKPLLLKLYKTNTLNSFLILLGLIIVTVVVNFRTIKGWQHSTKLLFVIGGSSFIIWWFFGSGITWYALPSFALCIPLLLGTMNNDDSGLLKDKYVRLPILITIFSGMIMLVLFRQESMMVTYSFDPKTPANTKINKLFLQYSHGAHNEDECLDIINKTIANTAQALNGGDDDKIIRVGTSMNYFINNNDKRVYEDNQLDLFNGVYQNWYGVKDIISDNFVKNNIRYILFDFATGNLDNTPDKSLTKKVGNFYDYISNNPRIEVINTDRLLEDPSSKDMITENGRQVPVRYGIFNGTRVIQTGSLVLLKIN